MKTKIKKLLLSLVVMVVAVVAVPQLFSVEAQAATRRGTCGSDLTWILDTETGELVIDGTGEMNDYTSSSSAPWYSYRSSVTTVKISDSVTSIGYYAFYNCTGLKELTMPVSAKIYNSQYTFYGCTNIEKVTLTKGDGTMQNYGTDSSSSATDMYYGYTPWYISRNSIKEFIIEDGVASIGDYAFRGCTGLTSVTIPDSVTSIGSYAFSGCTGLTSVTILDSVTSIGSYAFSGCTGLTSVIIPDSVTSIVDYAFYGCTGLTSITIPDSVTSIGYKAFHNCTGLKELALPASAKLSNSSYGYTFYGCTNIEKVTLTKGNGTMQNYGTSTSSSATDTYYQYTPWYISRNSIKEIIIEDGVTNIGSYAFRDCTSFTSITIPDSVTSIGNFAFCGCIGLKEITLPAYAKIYNDSCTFSGCTNIEKVTLTKGDGTMQNYGTSTSSSATNTCYEYTPWYISRNSIKEFIIENGVTTIGNYVFYGCTGLTSVTIPDSVTSIGRYAFSGCTRLTSITIGNGVTTIGDYTFRGCAGLTSITIPDSVTTIGYSAFSGCTGLISITVDSDNECFSSDSYGVLFNKDKTKLIQYPSNCASKQYVVPDSVTTIGEYAFYGCKGITSVTIPDSVTTIGSDAFYGCKGLTSVTIPGSVTTIGSFVFYGCTGLSSITIPDGVTTIGNYVFYGCKGLTSITIPDSVTSIGDYAFDSCTCLTSITIPDSVTSIGDEAFHNCTGLKELTLPASAKLSNSSYGYTFYGCTNIEKVTLTKGNGTMQNYGTSTSSSATDTYYQCTPWYVSNSLKEIIIEDGVTTIGTYAFYGCAGLTSITIPDSVTSIGDSAFRDCTGLTTVMIPDSVTTIGAQALGGCSMLTTVCFGGTEEEWNTIGYSDWPSPQPTIYFNHTQHVYDIEEITAYPTCTTAGVKTFYCVCGAVERTEVIPATGHSLKRITVDATCTQDGKSCYQCQNCLTEYNVTVVPAKGHTAGEWETKTAPTCESDGASVKRCTVCQAELETQVVPATGHTACKWETKTAPTCETDGVSVKKCTVCETELETQVIPATGHTAGEWETKTAPACEKDGVSVKKCTACQAELENKPIPATGHTAGEWVTKTKPTCEKDGVSVKKCTVCQTELETQAIPATGHTAGEWETKIAPTCVKDGVSVRKCTVCQAELETMPLPATGHSYNETIASSPTCTKKGEMKYTCHCGYSYTQPIPELAHDTVSYYIPPTCVEPGMEYYICNSCGNMIGDMEIIPETGHIYEWFVDTTPTATESGSKTQHCTACDETGETATIPATGFEPINGMVVDYADNTIYGLAAGIDSLDSYTEIVANGYEWVYEPGQYGFGTGSKAILKNGDEIIGEYTVVIFGDIQGDGWYDADDAFLANMIVAGLLTQENLPDYMWTAADCNHDGEINETDVDLLMGAGVKLNDIDQNAAQSELVTQSAYIEYMSIIDQSAGLDVEDAAPETNETVEPDELAEDPDFGILLAQIFLFIRKIFNLVFSFVI